MKKYAQKTKKKEVKPKKKKEIQVQDIEDIVADEQEPPPQPVKLVRQTNNTEPRPTFDYKPPEKISYEDMRKERIKQRIADRSVKIQNLFNNAI